MRVIKRSVLLEFGEDHPSARGPLDYWYHVVKHGRWKGPADVRKVFGNSVDFLANGRVVFDIKGNDYRLVGEINYQKKAIFIRFLGTHAEYDKIDAGTVKLY